MTQHWRRSADGHIDAGDLDASAPPRGGTESNRARAARGATGPDVLSVYLDGQRIAGASMEVGYGAADHERERQIHETAADMARAGTTHRE